MKNEMPLSQRKKENCNLCINSLYYMHSVVDFYEYKDHEVK